MAEHGGKPANDWRQTISKQLAEYMAPVLAPALEQLRESLAPVRESIVRQVFTPELRAALDQMIRQLPENWPRGIDIDKVAAVIQDDGLPLVWVPPADVVAAILDAPDRDARVALMLDRASELIRDCRRVLGDVRADRLVHQLPLPPKVLDAFEAGHHEAAQALAVVVIDAVIASWITGKFEAVQEQVRFDPEEVAIDEVRLQAAVAPLRNFKQRYFAKDGVAPPPGLNRQVTVHYAEARHFTKGNALVACLLMTSVLRALQDFEDSHQEEAP